MSDNKPNFDEVATNVNDFNVKIDDQNLDNTRITGWQIFTLRIFLSFFATFIICIQSWGVYCVVNSIIQSGKINESESFLTLIIGVTLGESYLIFKLIVEFVFSEKYNTDKVDIGLGKPK